jgi:hypothetical protein
LQNSEVQLRVEVVQQEERGLPVPAAEKLEFRELQEEDDHLLLSAG